MTKNTTTGELKSTNLETRARYALITSIFLTFAFLLGAVFSFYIARTTDISQFNTFSVIGAVSSILCILGTRYSRLKKVETAITLIFIGLILNIIYIVIFISGLGILLGMSGFIVIYIIASLTLVQPQSTWGILSGIAMAVSTILLDTFITFNRIDIGSVAVFVSILSVISLITFGYYIYQQFGNYPLRTKLIMLFILIVFFSVGSVAVVTNNLTRNVITQQVGQSQQVIAERLAFETGRDIDSQVEKLLATGIQFEEIARSASDSYGGSNAEIINQITSLDQEWINAPDQNALIQSVLENQTADELREFREIFPSHVELFLTDKYGANIAATNRTSDYYQADEDWWKLAYNLGRGKVYIGQPSFDESSQTYAMDIAIPIYANNEELVGILRSTYDVNAILNNLATESVGNTLTIELRTSSDTLITGETISVDDLLGLSTVMGGFGEINYKGEPSLVSQERVFSSGNASAREAITQLGWSIVVQENIVDALVPVRQQTRTITLISILVTALVGVMGFFASQRLAEPILKLTGVTSEVAGGNLSARAQITTQDEIGELSNTFNRMTSQLQDTLSGLERRVAERTADVELSRLLSDRRAQELQSISEISRAISTEQRLEILLPLITRLVSERFDLYHVGIFFVDDTRRFAYLQAANSEGGQRMLARGHRLDIGKGLVGTVAQTAKPRIALDVGSDIAFFDNPDLPNTRSEMALPLNIRGVTIGVLDVQSSKPGAFSESDAKTLGILGDQIAIAIENARLFGQAQQAREEAETLYEQIQRRDWAAFSQQEERIGYRQTSTGGKPIKKLVENDEIRKSLENGQVVVFNGKGKRSNPSIAVPVKLRGQTLGVLNIKAPTKDRQWNQDEINLAKAISDRLALALDNARLLQESQRRAAKEAKIGEVSARIGASINMRNVLETAVEELGRALPGSEVMIQFDSDEKKDRA